MIRMKIYESPSIAAKTSFITAVNKQDFIASMHAHRYARMIVYADEKLRINHNRYLSSCVGHFEVYLKRYLSFAIKTHLITI